MSDFVTRFAPSPNGPLHLGHSYSACLADHHARKNRGQMLLRIEDIDIGRSRLAFETKIYDDLAWLGLAWPQPVMRQSTRFPKYKAALDHLRSLGLVYPCWATRSEMRDAIEKSPVGWHNWPRDPDGAPLYPGLYRDISPQRQNDLMWQRHDFAWRLKIDQAQEMAERKNGGPLILSHLDPISGEVEPTETVDARPFGDIIIARKDIPTSYHLSVVIDDAAQNVTHIIRGQDLRAAAHIHRLLQVIFDLPTPAYMHHPLICLDEGRRLSKSAGDQGFRALAFEDPAALKRALPPPLGTGDFMISGPSS